MPSLRVATKIGVVLLVAVALPRAAHAECALLAPPSTVAGHSSADADFLIGGSSVFTAIPTSIDESRDTVAMSVTRVWKGTVHRDVLVYVVDGPGSLWPVSNFKAGTEYLLSLHEPPRAVDGEFALLGDMPVGTFVYMLNCGETPRPAPDVADALKRLGPGHPPLP